MVKKNQSLGAAGLNSALLGKLQNIPTENPAPQKVVQVAENKRSFETWFSFWCNTSVLKQLKKIALEEGTNVKELLVEGGLLVVRKRDPDFEPENG